MIRMEKHVKSGQIWGLMIIQLPRFIADLAYIGTMAHHLDDGARTVVLEPRLTRLDGAALEILEDVEISLQPKVKILAELLVIQQNGTSGLLD